MKKGETTRQLILDRATELARTAGLGRRVGVIGTLGTVRSGA